MTATETNIGINSNAQEEESAPAPTEVSDQKVFGLSDNGWRRSAIILFLVFTCLIPFFIQGFTLFQITLVGIYAIAILGLNLLTGFSGQVSLGHGSFFALGAYTSAIIVNTFETEVYITIPIAGLICLVVGFVIGVSVTRLEGLYLALATMGLAIATPQLLKYSLIEEWTGGVQGLDVFKPEAPFGIGLSADQWWYFIVLVILLLCLWATRNIINSRSGRAMKALRDNQLAAKSMGVNTTLNKAIVFGISSLYAGLAGSLYTIIIEFVAPDSFNLGLSFLFLIGMVIGGMASIFGTMIGACYVLFLPSVAENISADLAYFISGALLISTVFLLPSGAAGLFNNLLARLKRKLST